jgi:beta-N-acetylhexosaminidase
MACAAPQVAKAPLVRVAQPPLLQAKLIVAATPLPVPELDVKALVSSLSVEAMVGQVMMVGFAGTEVDPSVTTFIRDWGVGGVCLFKRNVVSAAQVAQLNDAVLALATDGVPPFIAVDQEGGPVVRVADGNLVLPGNMALGATRDATLAKEAGLAQGIDLRRLGFSMNLAPVLDVNINPNNPVIGARAFGDDVGLVASLGAAFVVGQQEAGLATVAKHFPGHGPVDVDSHRALPVVRAQEAIAREQLVPFAAAMAQGLDGMMTAHVAVPSLAQDEVPATLSPKLLGGVLRNELGFRGLVLTDELEMDAIDRRYGVGQAAVRALIAGADMVLVPWSDVKKREVREALLAAVRQGTLTRPRLEEAVTRIIALKAKRGLFSPLPPRAERLAALGQGRAISKSIARSALTLLKNDSAVPLEKALRPLVIGPTAFTNTFGARWPGALSIVSGPAAPTADERRAVRRLAQQAKAVVVAVSRRSDAEWVVNAQLSGTPVVAVVLGPPYLASLVRDAQGVVLAYSSHPDAQEAAIDALTLGSDWPGKLPVALPPWPFGFGAPRPNVAKAAP